MMRCGTKCSRKRSESEASFGAVADGCAAAPTESHWVGVSVHYGALRGDRASFPLIAPLASGMLMRRVCGGPAVLPSGSPSWEAHHSTYVFSAMKPLGSAHVQRLTEVRESARCRRVEVQRSGCHISADFDPVGQPEIESHAV